MVLIAHWRDDQVLATCSGQYPACPDPIQSKTAGRRDPNRNCGVRASLAKKPVGRVMPPSTFRGDACKFLISTPVSILVRLAI